ncbi:8968_t:CDS:2 [Ambispora gerdemannii]|uniref:8968_t:CDS:1 n=1 Tax=Ambispora gerdemannii TaxID=144530 RepID=A0A9N8Z5M6_9GLOM|nr:8968_t:CDS:2 [Ambispora gerdemannii]
MSIIFFPISLLYHEFHEICSRIVRFLDSKKKPTPQQEQEQEQEQEQAQGRQNHQILSIDDQSNNHQILSIDDQSNNEDKKNTIPPDTENHNTNNTTPTAAITESTTELTTESTTEEIPPSLRMGQDGKVNCGARLKELRRCIDIGVWTPNASKPNYHIRF